VGQGLDEITVDPGVCGTGGSGVDQEIESADIVPVGPDQCLPQRPPARHQREDDGVTAVLVFTLQSSTRGVVSGRPLAIGPRGCPGESLQLRLLQAP
jgi:hypothetical protein